ncbi:hypothetical protein QUF76_18010, partial [Desulfobacterales bacterium HSG16]|nr:hypothetical protein [Desulfobacterales bacterium HSG16]
SFGFASKCLCPLNDFDPARVAASDIVTRYYSREIHKSAFTLPPFMSKDLNGLIDTIPEQ